MSNREDFNAAVRVIEDDVLVALRNGWQPEGLAAKAEAAFKTLRAVAYSGLAPLSASEIAKIEAAYVVLRDAALATLPAVSAVDVAASIQAETIRLDELVASGFLTRAQADQQLVAITAGINAQRPGLPRQAAIQAESDRLDALVADGTLTRAQATQQLDAFKVQHPVSVTSASVPPLPVPSALLEPSTRRTQPQASR